MKNALLVGCGNTRGENIILGCKNAGYHVTNIGQTQSKIDGVNILGPVLAPIPKMKKKYRHFKVDWDNGKI